MGYLVLIRHGQARTFEKVSDELTLTGEEQARVLGAYWARHGERFDEVYSGALVRQRRTAELAGAAYAEAGLPWPELQLTTELNEYDSVGILERLLPALAERDEEFRKLAQEFEQHRQSADRNRYFQRMFEAATTTWIRGEMQIEGVEPWSSFSSRIRNAIRSIVHAEGTGRRVAVFTSGGVIATAVQTAVQAPDSQALEINWRVRNCSLTEFVFSKGRLSLDSFNSTPHLTEPRLRTYR